MKSLLLTITSLLTGSIIYAQTPCENGTAGSYPCDGYNLQSHISLNEMNAGAGNDSWGWTDPQDGKEYAIMGLDNGTAFIDISDPVNPVYLGKLPTQTSSSIWRDIKVYGNHAFIVSEAGGHGMQVFDLTRLRNVANPPQTFNNDAHYDGFGSAHNIAINEETGYAYAVGTDTYDGGPHFINIQDPQNPQFEGGFDGHFYCHDAQIIIYDGPDSDYTGKEIFMGSNEDVLSIVDVTDKSNPVGISTLSYPDVAYTHQGWFTEDRNYFIVGDELDEMFFGFNTRILVFDVSDLDNPVLHMEYTGPTPATDHNGYVVGDKYYLANYRAGLRVHDISDLENENFEQIGFFDTYPSNDDAGTDKLWSIYPYFSSGNIVLSDTDSGFLLVRDSELNTTRFENGNFSLYPNPATTAITITSKDDVIETIVVYNTIGQQVISISEIDKNNESIDIAKLPRGVYYLHINGSTTKKLIKN